MLKTKFLILLEIDIRLLGNNNFDLRSNEYQGSAQIFLILSTP